MELTEAGDQLVTGLTEVNLAEMHKLAWGIFGLIPLVPFVYVLTGADLF